MSVKKSNIFYKSLILCCLTFSCSNKDLESELNDWCSCEKEAAENPVLLDSCNQLMIDLSQKYEFDPEAVPIIQEKVKNCK